MAFHGLCRQGGATGGTGTGWEAIETTGGMIYGLIRRCKKNRMSGGAETMESAAMVEFGNQNAQSRRGSAVPKLRSSAAPRFRNSAAPREKNPSRTCEEALADVANFVRDIPGKIQTRSHGTAGKNMQLRSPLKALLRPETAMRPLKLVSGIGERRN